MLKIKYLGIGLTAICIIAMLVNAAVNGKQPFPEANLHMLFFVGSISGAFLTLFLFKHEH